MINKTDVKKLIEVIKKNNISFSDIESGANLGVGVISSMFESNKISVLDYEMTIAYLYDNGYYDISDSGEKVKTIKDKTPNIVVTNNGKLKEQPNSEVKKSLREHIEKINKDFGVGSVMFLNDKKQDDCKFIPTGSLGLDIALGIGGLPCGRIVEIYGPESSGKTSLSLHIISEAQKLGGICSFVDAEHAFDSSYAKKLGVDIDNLLISQPDYGEQALEIADRLISTGQISVIVIDSVAALIPKGELDGEMGDSKMGLHARLMSQACRKLVGTIAKTGTICIFINQLRDKIGVMFGSPETTTGGNALKFYSSVRLDVRRISQLKDGDNIIGNRVKVKIVKNKVAPPFKVIEYDFIYGEGISKSGEIVDKAVELGIIQKSGSWFSYNSDKLGQGKDNVITLFKDNPELELEIVSKIKSSLK